MSDPYACIADFYEAEYGDLNADIGHFVRNGIGGRVLVLGCGTGRVCRGFDGQRTVVGLDCSEAMVALARERGGDIAYVVGDMRDFDLGTFSEIIVPNAAFNFLPNRSDQASCLAACARSLQQGGRLTLDLPMPTWELLGLAHSPEQVAWEGRVCDRVVRRTRETWRDPVLQRLSLLDRFTANGDVVATSTLELRLVYPAEIEWMLEACGLFLDACFGDYSGGRCTAGSPRLLVHAMRA